jgi:hypothetical protein
VNGAEAVCTENFIRVDLMGHKNEGVLAKVIIEAGRGGRKRQDRSAREDF